MVARSRETRDSQSPFLRGIEFVGRSLGSFPTVISGLHPIEIALRGIQSFSIPQVVLRAVQIQRILAWFSPLHSGLNLSAENPGLEMLRYAHGALTICSSMKRVYYGPDRGRSPSAARGQGEALLENPRRLRSRRSAANRDGSRSDAAKCHTSGLLIEEANVSPLLPKPQKTKNFCRFRIAEDFNRIPIPTVTERLRDAGLHEHAVACPSATDLMLKQEGGETR